jgi:flagellar M-ring protein FliF
MPYMMTFIAILFAYLVIIRPLMRVLMPPPPSKEEEKNAEPGEGADGEDDGVVVELSATETAEDSYEKRVEHARELARSNPKHVSELLKEWMGLNEEGGRK